MHCKIIAFFQAENQLATCINTPIFSPHSGFHPEAQQLRALLQSRSISLSTLIILSPADSEGSTTVQPPIPNYLEINKQKDKEDEALSQGYSPTQSPLDSPFSKLSKGGLWKVKSCCLLSPIP